MSSRRHARTALPSYGFKVFFPFFGPRRTNLAALGDEHHVAVRLVAVHEMTEALQDLRVVDGLLPFALVGVDEALHMRLELRADAERVFAHNLAYVVDAALEILQPGARALQPVAGADIEDQEAVDVPYERGIVEVGRKKVRVARL